jgi:hypothetical protein
MKRNITLAILLIGSVIFLKFSAFAQTNTDWQNLFNGKDLSHWKVSGS